MYSERIISKMKVSVNCIFLGKTSLSDSFTVHVCDDNTIDKKEIKFEELKIEDLKFLIHDAMKTGIDNYRNLKLWKFDLNVNLKDIITEEQVKNNDKGEELYPVFPFKQYFPNRNAANESLIITIIPTSTVVPSQQGVSQGPNWNNASSIHAWMQQFTLNRGRNPLVKTFGKDFKFYGRDDAINILWNGDALTERNGIMSRFGVRNESDKNLHPIPVIACGPGTGKSRFLDEVERLLSQCANKSDDEEIRNAFTNMTVINTTYGSGSPASDMDVAIGAEASIAIRILYEYFQPQPKIGEFSFSSFRSLCSNFEVSNFTLDTALRVIYTDVMKIKQLTSSNPLLVLVLGIDEFNKLHNINKVISKKLVHSIGGIMCSSLNNIFFIPILAGTIEGPLDEYITESMHKPLRLPLYLLEESYSIEIGKAMKLFDDHYVNCNPYFRVSISDIGGHVRSLEYFYQAFKTKMQQQENINNVKIDDIMVSVKVNISDGYSLALYSKWLSEPLAKAILNLPVKKEDNIKQFKRDDDKLTCYQDLSSMGLINLVLVDRVANNYHIRIPYLWASILVQSSNDSGMKYWQTMFKYDEPMYWQNFERFNARFWALRLSLFRLLGYEEIPLQELLKGAIFSRDFPNVNVSIPENIKICKLRHWYPGNKAVIGSDDMEEDAEKDDDDMEEGDEMDDNYTEVDDETNTMEIITLDYPDENISKNTNYVFLNADGAPWDIFGFLNITYCTDKSGTLCLAKQVKITNENANKPMIIDQITFDKEHKKVTEAMKCVSPKWALLFLTNAKKKNLSIKNRKNSSLVSEKEFPEFYGYTYSSRAQFASANEKIQINAANEDSLKILGFNKTESSKICNKRKVRHFTDYDDVKTRVPISNKKFKKLKHDDRINFCIK